MRIVCYSFRDNNLRIRCSGIMAGTIFLILGIQGIFAIFNFEMNNISNIKLYAGLFIGLGLLLIMISTIKIKENEYRELEYF